MRNVIVVCSLSVAMLQVNLPTSHAQAITDPAFLPLTPGNSWTYYSVLHPPGRPATTVVHDTITVREQVRIDGADYYVYPLPLPPLMEVDTVRLDEAGRVFHRQHGEERLLFDFTLEDGATYEYTPPLAPVGDPENTFVVTVRRGLTRELLAGRFEQCTAFRFDLPEALDDERTYTFAPGVGLIEVGWPANDEFWLLYRAEVDGEVVTSREEHLLPGRISLEPIYPNPFSTSTILEFSLAEPVHVTLTIYDVLGREVEVLVDEVLPAQRHRIEWEAGGAVSGLLLAHLRAGTSVAVRPLVLIR